jgi:hypothetical protein
MYTTVKVQKTKDANKNFKVASEKRQITFKGTTVRLTDDFPKTLLKPEVNNIFKGLKEAIC